MWKILPSNPNYMVSDDGQIKSLRRDKILTPKQNHDGYQRIQIWEKNACHFVGLHRLIAEAFLPAPGEGATVVNHKDGNKANNRVENLEWVTQQENIRHAWETGLSKQHLNINGRTIRQFTKAGEFIREFPSTMEAERILGISHTNISSAIQRKGTAGGYRWEGVVPV